MVWKSNMKKLIILDVVCLTKAHLEMVSLPNISKIINTGISIPIKTTFPAVTCSVQSSIASGHYPSEHGIISNGLFNRETNQVAFWEQYSSLVKKPRIWDIIKNSDKKLKTAVLFWQNSLYINSDVVVTPKPIHLDKEMVTWCYSKPINFYEDLSKEIGEFDLKWYWGPMASIKASQWIIQATQHTIKTYQSDLILVYLPHLDYEAQKNGIASFEFKKSLQELDSVIGKLLDFLDLNDLKNDYEIMLVSEYSFSNVNKSISPNLILRQQELLKTRQIKGRDYIDFEFSKAFAMVDHQIANVFVKPRYEQQVIDIFKDVKNIEKILDKKAKKSFNIDHPNSGELILCSDSDTWFNYYWWDDIKRAPPYSFNVDIHRKPGYDPLELFFDPITKSISQNVSLIHGSHGLVQTQHVDDMPLFVYSRKKIPRSDIIDVTQIAPTIADFFGIKHDLPHKPIW